MRLPIFACIPSELKNCISPGLHTGTAIIWVAMLFGFKAAPLVMGRLSAAIGRLLQSLFHPAAGQVQVYIEGHKGAPELSAVQGAACPSRIWSSSSDAQRGAWSAHNVDRNNHLTCRPTKSSWAPRRRWWTR